MNTEEDASRSTDISLRTAAIAGGLGLLVNAILAGIANLSIFQNLVVLGDARATAERIMASAGSFRMGVFFFLVAAILDVVVAWALYVLLKPTNKSLSTCRLVQAGLCRDLRSRPSQPLQCPAASRRGGLLEGT